MGKGQIKVDGWNHQETREWSNEKSQLTTWIKPSAPFVTGSIIYTKFIRLGKCTILALVVERVPWCSLGWKFWWFEGLVVLEFFKFFRVWFRRAGLSISKTADLLEFSCTTISRVYREWSEKEKISSERQLCGWKCLVNVRSQRRMGRLVRDNRKATVTQITTRYNIGVQNIISVRTQHVEPWSRWTTSAEDHAGCCSCQLRTGNGGYNSHRLTKIGQ